MLEVGYPPTTAKNPQQVTESKGFKELMVEFLPDSKLIKKHESLLNSQRLDHMVFPLGPEDEDEGRLPERYKERTSLTDKEITDMLKEVNCQVRRIVHGETARHVYFWAPDNKSQKEALDMAYKLKGSYAPDKSINVNIDTDIGSRDPELQSLRDEFNEKARARVVKQIQDNGSPTS